MKKECEISNHPQDTVGMTWTIEMAEDQII
jgi:hypothetical protein